MGFFDTVQSEGALVVKAIISLYIVVNPTGVSSIFLGLTKELPRPVRLSIAFRACVGGRNHDRFAARRDNAEPSDLHGRCNRFLTA